MNQQKPKRKISKALVALTLLLAILVTGFGSPGFLLDFFSKKPHVKLTSEQTTVEQFAPLTGNSQPVHLQPTSYVTLDAPQNAFTSSRTVTMEPLSEEEVDNYNSVIIDELDGGMLALDAFHIDAGMETDEVMPGSYTVSYDLSAIGLPEDLWPFVCAYRIDDDGYWDEYATWFEGSNLMLESRQNSVLIYCCIVVGTYVLVDEFLTDMGGLGWTWEGISRYFSVEKDMFVYDNNDWRTGKKIFKMRYTYDDTVGELINRKKVIESNVLDHYGMNESKKAYAELHGIEDPSTVNKNTYPDFMAFREQDLQAQYLKDNEYKAIMEELKKVAKNNLYRIEMLTKIAERLRWAYFYLKDEIKLQMPGLMNVRLSYTSGGEGAAGVTVNPVIWKSSYLLLNTSYLAVDPAKRYDTMLLTATHEYFHACQRTYRKRLANIKYDEAIAQMLEEDAREYYRREGKITSYPSCPNGSKLEMYALPLNDLSVTYPETSKDFGGLFSTSKADTGYPLAHFIRYLNNKQSTKKTYANFCSAYGEYWTTPDVTELLGSLFGYSEEALSTQYVLFARQKQAMFYEMAKSLFDNVDRNKRWGFPTTIGEQSNGYRVAVNDHAYTIRTRYLTSIIPEGYIGDVCMLLVPEDDFAEQMPDFKLYGVGLHHTKKVKYGLFFDKAEFFTEYYVMEVDGGTSNTGNTSGYRVWTLIEPQFEERPVVKDRLLKFTLPAKSDVAKAGYINGYRVTIKSSDGKETVKHYRIGAAGKEIALKVKNLVGPDVKEDDLDSITFDVKICEYIKERDGTRTYGPESDPNGSMEAAMNETLLEMGAGEGVITISLGWQTADDLDLHVSTPDGSEIYYGNKVAGGGELDVDMQVSEIVANPAEHVKFVNPQNGTYKVWVHNYTDRTEDYDSPFLVVVKVKDEIKRFRLSAGGGSTQVYTFTFGPTEGEETGQEFLD